MPATDTSIRAALMRAGISAGNADELDDLLFTVSEAAAQRTTYYLGLFGDSHTNAAYYTSGASPDGLTPSAFFVDSAADNLGRSWGWPAWIGPMSMQRAQVVKSWARQTNGLLTAGTTPAGVPLSVQVTQALADPLWSTVNRAVLMVGFNDSAFTLSAATAELLTQIGRIGKPVDLLAPPPGSTGHTSASGESPLPIWAWRLEWRAVLKRIADASRGRVRFVDTYTPVTDATTSPAVYLSGHALPDNIHPNNVGAYKIADAYIQSLFPTGIGGDLDIWPHNSSAATTNCARLDQGFVNPTLATASGGVGTGVVAGGLTIANVGGATHTGSVSANTMTGGTGNMQTIAINSTVDADGITVASGQFHDAGGVFLAAGDRAWAQCMVRVNGGGIYPRNLQLSLFGVQSGANRTIQLFELNATNEAALPMSGARTFLLRTPTMTMPSGPAYTALYLRQRFAFAGAGACTVDIGNIECRRFRTGEVYV